MQILRLEHRSEYSGTGRGQKKFKRDVFFLRMPRLIASLRVRIRAENFQVTALATKHGDSLPHFRVFHVSITINEKVIFPRLPFTGA